MWFICHIFNRFLGQIFIQCCKGKQYNQWFFAGVALIIILAFYKSLLISPICFWWSEAIMLSYLVYFSSSQCFINLFWFHFFLLFLLNLINVSASLYLISIVKCHPQQNIVWEMFSPFKATVLHSNFINFGIDLSSILLNLDAAGFLFFTGCSDVCLCSDSLHALD